jgi:hypothetical protein
MKLTHHPLLVLWSRKGRAVPLFPLWAVQPVQSLSACTRVNFTLLFTTCFDCTDQPSSSRCQIQKNKWKGREASLYGGMNYKNIILKNGITRLKLIHNHVTEFLRYNLNGTAN